MPQEKEEIFFTTGDEPMLMRFAGGGGANMRNEVPPQYAQYPGPAPEPRPASVVSSIPFTARIQQWLDGVH